MRTCLVILLFLSVNELIPPGEAGQCVNFVCEDVTQEEITEYLNSFSSSINSLTVTNGNFNGILDSKWLAKSETSKLYTINVIKLQKTFITSIDDAFSKPLHGNTESYEFDEIYGLEKLEKDVLGDLNTIGHFKYTNSDLKIIELQFPSGFSSLHWWESLDLSNNQLETLPDGFFDDMAFLEYVDLSGNPFKTLPAEIFDFIITYSKFRKLILDGDKWECNCILKHLFDTITKYRSKFDEIALDRMRCSTPSHWTEMPFMAAPWDECDPPTTTNAATHPTTTDETQVNTTVTQPVEEIETTTEPITSQESSEEINEVIDLTCHPSNGSYPSELITIEMNFKSFQIIHVSKNKILIEYECNTVKGCALIWFTDHTENSYNCIHDRSGVISVFLDEDTVYTFCILNMNHPDQLAIGNCRSYYSGVREIIYFNIWETNGSLIFGFTILLILIFLSVLLGSFLVFKLLYHKPELMKGNKRLIFISNSILVMPKDFQQNESMKDAISSLSMISNETKQTNLPERRSSDSTLYGTTLSTHSNNLIYSDNSIISYLELIKSAPLYTSVQKKSDRLTVINESKERGEPIYETID